ncbi:transducin (beta)-like 1 [Nematocida sp. LUAm3]|nr:transducin (beta)-like 1 [Nematocida sp. LUAm3]KAI5174106.1 transducin (beta)-like 1 [Nematocida sp. LUAm2]KAI5177151.1 transducin (beta)-like 1 [Nematocida sp. LUAm1]
MITLTSTELNYLIYRYLLEEGYEHSAYTFGKESMIDENPNVPQIPPDAIKTYVTKGVEMEYIEKHTDSSGSIKACTSKYSIFSSHVCIEQGIDISPIYLASQESDISLCAWAKSGELVTGSLNCTLRKWAPPEIKAEWKLGLNEGNSHGVTAVAIESDSSFGTQEKETTTVGALFNGTLFVSKKNHQWINPHAHKGPIVALSLKEEQLITGGWDGTCKKWIVEDNQLVDARKWTLHTGPVMDVIMFKEGFSTCSVDGTICYINMNGGITRLSGHTGEVNALKSVEDTLISCSDDKTVKLWNVKSSSAMGTLSGHTKEVYAIDCTSTLIASVSFDADARLWDIESQKNLAVLKRHTKPIYSTAFSKDERLLATGGLDSMVCLWDVRSNEIAKEFKVGSGVYQVEFSEDNKLLSICSSDHRPILLNIKK